VTADFNQDDTGVGVDQPQVIAEAGSSSSTHLTCPVGEVPVTTILHTINVGNISGQDVVTSTDNEQIDEPFFFAVP
jgi:hypothetical protein